MPLAARVSQDADAESTGSSDDESSKRAEGSPIAAVIPLLPPLVEFMDPRSLCHYSGTSKTLRKDVRDTKAWALLADAQLPRIKRDVAREALIQVKSYVRRRLLADALSQDTPPPLAFRPNRLQDFTFFVRFEEDGRMIWEGDLKCKPISHFVWFDLGPVWNAIKRARSWVSMEQNLTIPGPLDHLDVSGWTSVRWQPWRGVKITIIAIRDEDDAMVSLGQFIVDDIDDSMSSNVCTDFKSRTALFSSARFDLRPMAILQVVLDSRIHNAPTVHGLELRLQHFSVEAGNFDEFLETHDNSHWEHLLSYLAGTHHLARAPALATIESWHVEAFRRLMEELRTRGP